MTECNGMNEITVIVYTTQYRDGGGHFERVAHTMARELGATEVLCKATESKQELKGLFREIAISGSRIKAFHFVGHSGMYGPMFGRVSFPEQFSPYELGILEIPFAADAKAYFHCCRSARWFAPYFSKVQNVTTYGYHWYTSFSLRKDRYRRIYPWSDTSVLYCFGAPGRKSHGLLASIKKLAGCMNAEAMRKFEPGQQEDRSYDEVADLYAKTFQDIEVRTDEYQFIKKSLPPKAETVLDIGCGNGALLRSLRTDIQRGIGVDVSGNLLHHARSASEEMANLSFQQIEGPVLPFGDNSMDVVISLLSFRYLDWDPMMAEIERVLKQEGRLIIVDMVTAPVRVHEWPMFLWGKVQHYLNRYRYPEFHNNLQKMVKHPAWQKMLQHNPIRSQHEMKWYLESRFPGRKVKRINIGLHSRILAFQSGDMKNVEPIPLTYP